MTPESNFSSAVVAFREAAEAALGAIPAAIEPDGALHRFRTENDRPSQRSGWYIFHLDGVPAGAFGDWRTGHQDTWCAANRAQLPQAEREAVYRRFREQRELARQHREANHRATAVKARKVWGWASTADPAHPYLQAKQVPSYGLRQHGAALLVPLTDGEALVNLQRIYPDGRKRFVAGGQVKGCYSPIGHGDGILYICEGWSTGATIHRLTGQPIVCAMNAGNMTPVAQTLRRRYPGRRVIVAGDNDRFTPGNPGKTAAMRAAKAIGAEWMVPSFPDELPGTDYNDLAGLEMEGRL